MPGSIKQVQGSITNSDGYLLPDIEVTAYQYKESSASWQMIRASDSNDEGEYTIGGLSSGTYRLRFYDAQGNYVTQYYDGADNLENASDIAVTAGQSTTGIDSQLAKGPQ